LKRHILTEEKLDDIRSAWEASPNNSLRLLFIQCWLAKSRALVSTNLLMLRPNKTTVVLTYRLLISKQHTGIPDGFRTLYSVGYLTQNLPFILMNRGQFYMFRRSKN
jgi:hypothetical protein